MELTDLINILVTIIGLTLAYYIGRMQAKHDMRYITYGEFLDVLSRGKTQFPTTSQTIRTTEELNELVEWFQAFESTRGKIKVFGSKEVNKTIDNKLEEDDKLNPTLIDQLELLKIKLNLDQLKLSKQLNSKDKYDRFYKEISAVMEREFSKPL